MPAKKFWEDYPEPVVDTGSGCLRWQGPRDPEGYGRIFGGSLAHREAWERANGPIPEGLTIDHVAARGCRWRDCVLVAHLEPVTRAENIRRGRNIHREKTHCPQNHSYSEDNTIYRYGRRYCRACKNANARKQRKIKKELV